MLNLLKLNRPLFSCASQPRIRLQVPSAIKSEEANGTCPKPAKASKVLVVEDDPLTQRLIAGVLKSAGYEVATAQDGASAITKAREFEPDLVTLDIMLAQSSPSDSWDGLSVAGWLRRVNQGRPIPAIIVVSGLEPGKIIEGASAVGAFTFLPKPILRQKLLDVVAAALASITTAPAPQPGSAPSA
jgi:two-component system, OmpR family, response regulator